jgi:lipopolysaccharide export system permease protein
MILQRYILRELLQAFLFTLAAVMSVCLVGTMFQVIRNFEGVGLVVILKVLPLALGYVAGWALLAAVTTATTLVYGRLSAENEINAMRTCGIHANRMIAPAVLFGLLVCTGSWILNEEIVPYTRHARRMAFREATLEALRLPPPGHQEFRIGKVRLSYADYRDGRMERPSLMQFEGSRIVMEYFAPSGRIQADADSIRLVMSKPRYRQFDEKGGEQSFTAESDVSIPLELEDLTRVEPRLEDRPLGELRELRERTEDPRRLASIDTIVQTRFAASAAPLLLVLVSVPIGMLVKRGSRLAGLGAALPPLLVYFVSFFVFQGLGDKGRIHPVLAAWAPDAFLAVLALILLGGVYRR